MKILLLEDDLELCKNTLSSTKKLMQRIKNDVFNFDRA